MTRSKKFFKTSEKILLLIFSIIGMITSSILLYATYIIESLPPGCYLNQEIIPGISIDCIKVFSSEHSSIFSIPFVVLAFVYFAIDILLNYLLILRRSNFLKNLIFVFRTIGIIFIPYLIYLEFFVINSLCIYCTVMQLMILVNFVYFFKLRRNLWIQNSSKFIYFPNF